MTIKLLLDWTNKVQNVPINTPPNAGTNYDAGLMAREEQFNKMQNSNNSKLMLFISDAVPTLYSPRRDMEWIKSRGIAML